MLFHHYLYLFLLFVIKHRLHLLLLECHHHRYRKYLPIHHYLHLCLFLLIRRRSRSTLFPLPTLYCPRYRRLDLHYLVSHHHLYLH